MELEQQSHLIFSTWNPYIYMLYIVYIYAYAHAVSMLMFNQKLSI